MIKAIFFLKRRPDISAEQFRDHYESSHVKLAEKYIGHLLLKYTRNYPQFATLNPSNNKPGAPPAPYDVGYDAITEMWFPDQAAAEEVMRIFNDPEISPILAADEVKFLVREQTVMIIVEEVHSPAELLSAGAREMA